MLLLGFALNPRPAAIAKSARKASAATIQGKEFVRDSPDPRGGLAPPAGAPHRWQNLAPGPSSAEHEAHDAPASAAPQFAQYRPLASVPQEAQVVGESDEAEGGDVMR
jgi:hypothetical protein